MDDLVARILIAALMAAAGAAIIWTARAGASGRLRRNNWAGIRTRATLASDDAWLAAHQAARRPTEAGGWIAVVAGLAIMVLPAQTEIAIVVGALGGSVLMLGFVLLGARRGTVAARQTTRLD